jgi:hypothetical protein
MERWLFTVTVVTLAAGCTLSGPPPRAQAAAAEASCVTDDASQDPRIIGPRYIDRVEPLYAIVDSTPNGMESRLIGAKIHMRSIEGATADSVGHALTCYAARETLRGANVRCPYVVPDAWVTIDVKSDPLGYEVFVRGNDFQEAHQILERARMFAED